MIDISYTIILITTILVFVGLAFYGSRAEIKKHVRNIKSRQKTVEAAVGQHVTYTYQPLALDEYVQRVVNAALQQPPKSIDEMVTANGWMYMLCSNSLGPFISLYVFDLEEYSPHILMRRSNYGGTTLRFFAQLVESQSLLLCEGIVDKDYDIFSEKGGELDALSILSPDALEPLHDAPYGSTVMIKHDKLYYMIYGHKSVEETFVAIDSHSKRAISALEDNIGRWSRSQANKDKVDKLLAQPIGVSDVEYFDHPHGKIFTEF
jgi:hypothetical protein